LLWRHEVFFNFSISGKINAGIQEGKHGESDEKSG
jgi:hypothetical protein